MPRKYQKGVGKPKSLRFGGKTCENHLVDERPRSRSARGLCVGTLPSSLDDPRTEDLRCNMVDEGWAGQQQHGGMGATSGCGFRPRMRDADGDGVLHAGVGGCFGPLQCDVEVCGRQQGDGFVGCRRPQQRDVVGDGQRRDEASSNKTRNLMGIQKVMASDAPATVMGTVCATVQAEVGWRRDPAKWYCEKYYVNATLVREVCRTLDFFLNLMLFLRPIRPVSSGGGAQDRLRRRMLFNNIGEVGCGSGKTRRSAVSKR